MLAIALLGLPRVALDQQPITALRRKNRALLFFLAQQHQPVSRDHLLPSLWPDHDRAAAQGILRTMLHDLRRHVGGAILADGDRLSLQAEVDTHLFEAELAAQPTGAALTNCLARYRGEFLEGFSLPEAPEFEDWV